MNREPVGNGGLRRAAVVIVFLGAPLVSVSGGACGGGAAGSHTDGQVSVSVDGGTPMLTPTTTVDPAASLPPVAGSPCGWIGTGSIYDVQFVMGGRVVSADGPAGVRLYDAATGAPLRVLPRNSSVVSHLSYSSDGARVAYPSGTIVGVWSTGDGTLIRSFDSLTVAGVGLSPDGATIALGRYDGHVTVLRVADGSQIADFAAHMYGTQSLAFSPDAATLASSDGHVIRFWSTGSYAMLREDAGPKDHYRYLFNFSPDGQYVATGGADIFRVSDGTPAVAGSGASLFAAFTSDSTAYFSVSKTGVLVLSSFSNDASAIRQTWMLSGSTDSAAVSPDGRQVVTGGLMAVG